MAVYVVRSNPAPGREEEYNSWYSHQHLVEMLAVPGFISAQRFEIDAVQIDGGPPSSPYRYLAIYDIAGDPHDALRALLAAVESGMSVSDALSTDVESYVYNAITDRVVGKGER